MCSVAFRQVRSAIFPANGLIESHRFLRRVSVVFLAGDFAYPEQLPASWVAGIRRMRVRIERERVRPPEAARFAFKLGYGSLADVQFAVELALVTLTTSISSYWTAFALDRAGWSPQTLSFVVGASFCVPGLLWMLILSRWRTPPHLPAGV